MNQEIVELLNRIQAANAAIGSHFARASPVGQAEIDRVEGYLGTSIPEEVLTLFQWSNGADFVDGQISTLFEGEALAPMTLDQAGAEALRVRSACFERDGSESFGSFYPYPAIVVANAYEALQVVVSLVDGSAGSVWLWKNYGDICIPAFDSFAGFLEMQVALVESGVVKPASFGGFFVDQQDPRFARLDISNGWRQANYW